MPQLIEDRINRWRDKLIDLSKRNRLLNFKPTKVTTVRVIDELPPEIFRLVVSGNNTMEFLSIPDEDDEKTLFGDSNNDKNVDEVESEFETYDSENLEEKHSDTNLQTDLKKEQLEKNLFRIYSKAASVMEEQGYNVLYLSLGCLEWYEADNSDIKFKAPILLVPVELQRKSVKKKFKLAYTEETPLLNPALVVKLEKEFNIKLDPLPDEFENISVQELFSTVQEAVKNLKRWKVTNDIYLSLFSFAKFVMFKDLENNLEATLENDVIKILCGQQPSERTSLSLMCELNELEKNLHPLEIFQIRDADSSQQQAMLAVKNGSNLLIEGPPGTGKSQTIANIIAESLAANKKVLFVSQKMAALEVVKKRLDGAGLGDFCMELHSRKTDKKEVVKELARIAELERRPDHDHDEDLAKLEDVRDKLNAYIKDLHMPYGALGMTPYQAFGIVSSHSDVSGLNYIFRDITSWDRKKYNKCCDLLGSLSHNLASVYHPDQHPWNGSTLTDLSYEEKLELQATMQKVLDEISSLLGYLNKLANQIAFVEPKTLMETQPMLDAAALMANSPKAPAAILKNEKWNSLGRDISEIIDAVKAFNKFSEDITGKYDKKVISLDVEALLTRYKKYATSGFFFLIPSFWSDKKLVSEIIITGHKPKFKDLVSALELACSGKKTAGKIDSSNSAGKELFGDIWNGRDTDWKLLDDFTQWILKFRRYVVDKHFTDEIFEEAKQTSIDAKSLKALADKIFADISSIWVSLSKILKIAHVVDEQKTFGTDLKSTPFDLIFKKIDGMFKTLDNVDRWMRYQTSLKACESEGLKEFIEKVISEKIDSQKIAAIFKNQFLKSWVSMVFSEREALKQFYGQDHQELISTFRTLDKNQIELAKIRIQHRLSGKIHMTDDAADNSELGILLRESRKQRAQKPIRILFQKIPRLIVALKPCLMMSPLTVAQFLDPKHIQFDVIIFDEASQIPPEDSIGAIMRGKQVVVAGDSKQLPPTSFFQSEVLTPEDEDESLEDTMPPDLDSILDECAVSRFPKTMLKWHYRSRHEALIAFSNKHLYDSRLYTFPCAEEKCDGLGIKLHHMPQNVYERGLSGANLDEAKAVAQAVLQHYREYPDKSLGVGTFSIRQKYAIDDAIEALLKEDNTLEGCFSKDKSEHFFVKNLESIQGDERDVVFLSIGYGKDGNGRLSMNFGPLNKNGGERRLNVLITRARLRVDVFSSIKGSDFELSKTESRGVHLLKKYLDFAENGAVALTQDTDELGDEFSESPFEEAVYNALVGLGHKLRKQVGCSGYRIDMAVIDDNNPGRYVLAIECDGANYHSFATARDRDRLRQYILEDLGWTIHRVWSTDWFKNPTRELSKIVAAIEESRAQNGKKKLLTPEPLDIVYKPVSNVSKTKVTDSPKRYRLAQVERRHPSDTFYNRSDDKIAQVLISVVDCEGPIHIDEARRRVAQFWGIGAVKSRVNEILELAQNYCTRRGLIKKNGNFLWPAKMITPKVRCRDSEEVSNDVELIAPEEISEAAVMALRREYSMPKEDLITKTAELLGISRVTEGIEKLIWKAIVNYRKSGKIKEVDGRFVLCVR